MKRREFLQGSASAAAMPLAIGGFGPLFAAGAKFAPAVRAASGFGGLTKADQFVTTGSANHPHWHVYYAKNDEDGINERDSLVAWVESSSARRVVSEHQQRGRMTIRASVSDVGASFIDDTLNRGLQSRSWVESIDIAMKANVPEPLLSVDEASEFSMGFGLIDQLQAGTQSYQKTGLAFNEDATAASVDEIVGYIGGESR
jgi:hypothetical protein